MRMDKDISFSYIGAKLYSLIAAKSPFMKDIYRNVAEEITSFISTGKILDVGTGSGVLPLEIAKRKQGLEITGIDIAPGMVRIASRAAEKMGLSGSIRFKIASAMALPFEDGYFDLVFSTLSFHHWAKPAECLREILRVLRKDGEAWIYDIRRDITEEVNRKVKEKYGMILSFILLNLVRKHSSVTLERIEKILSSPEIKFSEKKIEDKGIILKIRLVK